MPAKRQSVPELPSPRRHCEGFELEKFLDDLRALIAAKQLTHLPSAADIPFDYWYLKSAPRKRSYCETCDDLGSTPDPGYYIDPRKLNDEIEKYFLDPQKSLREGYEGLKPDKPSYDGLKDFPELNEGARLFSGLSATCREELRFVPKLTRSCAADGIQRASTCPQ